MANEKNSNADDAREELSAQLRTAVANAYAFVQGQEATDSFSALTFEECLDAQVQRIEGPGTDIRPNVLDRVKKVKEVLLAAIEQIKQLPDSFFKAPDDGVDAVTSEEPEDPIDKIYSS